MTTTSYLLSGVTLASTGVLYVGGIDRFTVSLHGANNGSDTPTGTLFLYGRLHSEMPYATIITIIFLVLDRRIILYHNLMVLLNLYKGF